MGENESTKLKTLIAKEREKDKEKRERGRDTLTSTNLLFYTLYGSVSDIS